MTIFITSDQHFYHSNVLDFEDRPYDTMEEMNAGMIEVWNSVVKKTDTVYHLGDFCFGNQEKWKEVLNGLRGDIILIKGNHDKTKIVTPLFNQGWLKEYHSLGVMIKNDGMFLNLSHYAMMIGARPRNFSIHGHLHSEDTGFTNHVNVGVDSTLAKKLGKPFGTPIMMDELIQHLHEINPLVEAERASLYSKESL